LHVIDRRRAEELAAVAATGRTHLLLVHRIHEALGLG